MAICLPNSLNDARARRRSRRIPRLAYSTASDLVAALAPFVNAVSKAGTREFAWSVRLVVIWTTWPLPCFSISATASCVIWKKPVVLTSFCALGVVERRPIGLRDTGWREAMLCRNGKRIFTGRQTLFR